VSFISPTYDSEGHDYRWITGEIRRWVQKESFHSVGLVDPEINVVGDLATVRLKMQIEGGTAVPAGYGHAVVMEFSLRKVEGKWWIDGIRPKDPFQPSGNSGP
jgi:hypothetical protein